MIQNPGENHDEIAPIASDPSVQFSSVDKPEAAHIIWWKRPEALAVAVLLMAIALNIFFY